MNLTIKGDKEMQNLNVNHDEDINLEPDNKLNEYNIENEELKKEKIKLEKRIIKANNKVAAYQQSLKYLNEEWDLLSFDKIDYLIDKKQLTKIQLINKYEGKQIYWELVINDVEASGLVLAEIDREIRNLSDFYYSSQKFVLVDVFNNIKITPIEFNKNDRITVLGTFRKEKSSELHYVPHIEVHSIEKLI